MGNLSYGTRCTDRTKLEDAVAEAVRAVYDAAPENLESSRSMERAAVKALQQHVEEHGCEPQIARPRSVLVAAAAAEPVLYVVRAASGTDLFRVICDYLQFRRQGARSFSTGAGRPVRVSAGQLFDRFAAVQAHATFNR
jgi:hypothetical protein